ncbi:MAG: hypothetical protein SFU98_21930 [Leptospiraceae bacterium]|nr:hypothetical protein [Leptospiraceae bacterium]
MKQYQSFLIFIVLYLVVSVFIWKKYSWNITSQVHFGEEFAKQNSSKMPIGAIVEKGSADDLGAGYDGQIFYFYSRTISELSLDWPKGFDESYRAPRIGYPLLIGIFGFLGRNAAILGMYFLNLGLLYLSFLAIRELLGKQKHLAIFYLLSPFALGSYSVLVSDSVMTSLVVLAYYFMVKKRYLFFILISSLAILTKEPALFLFFPLGLVALIEKRWKEALVVLATLIIPILWQGYLKITFPNWSATRLTDFLTPAEGIYTYIKSFGNTNIENWKELARLSSRIPLLALLGLGIITLFTGNFRKGLVFRIGLVLNFFMIVTASHYHFWSVYENISRMFTVSIPLMIFLKKEDEEAKVEPYLWLSIFILVLFLIKVIFIQKAQGYSIWTG